MLAALLIVGLVFRSYWTLAVVSTTFLVLLIWLKGISNLIGFKDDLVLSLIVPIAMISFGVDYAFHAIGRFREEQATVLPAARAAAAGGAAVSGALVLATLSDSVAFLANVTAGIESIIQFGIGSAIALVSAWLLLGVVAPLVIAWIEERVPAPTPGVVPTTARIAGALGSAILAIAAVLFLVFVLPWLGVVLTALSAVFTLVVPVWWQSRKQQAPVDEPNADQVPMAGTGPFAKRLGKLVAAVASGRAVVLPAAALLTAVASFLAVQVEAEFDVEDFFASDTDFVQGLNQLDEHVGSRNGEPASVYIEGDLTNPENLSLLRDRLDEIQSLDNANLARDNNGVRLFDYGILEIVDQTWESPAMPDLVAGETGVELTDNNNDTIPDTTEQIEALLSVAMNTGIPINESEVAMTPDDVAVRISLGDPIEGQDTDANYAEDATTATMGITNSRSQETVKDVRSDLKPIAAAISDDFGGTFVQPTGSPFVREGGLEGVNRALLVSLPVAIMACFIVAALFLRSIRYGLVSVIPIIMVVAWLYAFMELTGYSINLVTATIGAVSIGIGIDFALHYISRYREELDRRGKRNEAVAAAGEGTGLALVASAFSSAVGFGILALAPMPLFASYGLLTAVMIIMALIATLAVLPGILVTISTDREKRTHNLISFI